MHLGWTFGQAPRKVVSIRAAKANAQSRAPHLSPVIQDYYLAKKNRQLLATDPHQRSPTGMHRSNTQNAEFKRPGQQASQGQRAPICRHSRPGSHTPGKSVTSAKWSVKVGEENKAKTYITRTFLDFQLISYSKLAYTFLHFHFPVYYSMPSLSQVRV